MAIKLQATFDRASTRKDGCLGLGFSTQELSVADKVTILEFVDKSGWLLFSENENEVSRVPKERARDGKSPSQRLRSAIYVLWEKRGCKGSAESFYERSMERAIEHVKGQFND